MSVEILSLLMFAAFLILLALGLPIAFVMAGVGIITSLLLWGWASTASIILITFATVSNIILVAAPLYILMGYLLENSGIAENLYDMFYKWSSGLRGGLAVSTVFICVLFAAMTGIIAAATVTMGVIALPAMLKRGYDKKMAVGTIAASGTLGILIPPSIMMIILCTVTQQSVGKIFAAGIGSGGLMALLFTAYILIRAKIQPDLCPATVEKFTWKQKFQSLPGAIAPMILIIGVLGSIFAGVATPTEASAWSAVGALLCIAIYKKFNWKTIKQSFEKTVINTAMVMWIIVGAATFVSVYIKIGAVGLVTNLLVGMNMEIWATVAIMLFIIFILGMFVEPAGIIMLVGPLFALIAREIGLDMVWFGVLFVIMLQIGYLTPPFGISLFFMRAVCPPEIKTVDIYKSIIPFVTIMVITAICIIAYPPIATWLPSVLVK